MRISHDSPIARAVLILDAQDQLVGMVHSLDTEANTITRLVVRDGRAVAAENGQWLTTTESLDGYRVVIDLAYLEPQIKDLLPLSDEVTSNVRDH
jgi:hypothetical protein